MTADSHVSEKQVQHLEPARAPLDWGREFSEALSWLNQRAWALGGALLFVAATYLHNYITVEKLPLSISSPAAMAAFPAVLALSLFVLVLLGAMLLMPTAVLLTPTGKGRGALIDRMLDDAGGNQRWPMRPQLHWIGGTVLIGVLFWASIWWIAESKQGEWIWGISLMLVALTIVLAIAMVRAAGLVRKLREISLDYWLAAVLAGVMQALLLLSVMQLAISMVDRQTTTFLSFVPVMILAAALAAVFQLAGMFVVKVLQIHPRPLVVAGTLSAVVMGCSLLWAPVSARLVGYAIQKTANGGRDCVFLVFMPSASGKYKAEGFNDGVGRSSGLRIMFDAGDMLHVRFARDRESKGPVYWVARNDVAGVEGCKSGRAE